MLGMANSIYTGGVISVSDFSLAFDGTGDYVSFGPQTYLIQGSGVGFAIAFWAKRAGTGTQDVVMGNSSTGAWSRIYFDAAGTKLYIETDMNGQEAYATVTADTNWHHYIINSKHSGSSLVAEVTMYEDSVDTGVTNTNFGSEPAKHLTVNQIGDDGGGTTDFHGNLTQIITFDIVLGSADRTKLYNSGFLLTKLDTLANYNDILHAWRFSEGIGNTTYSYAGGNSPYPQFLGTLQGNTAWSEDTPGA